MVARRRFRFGLAISRLVGVATVACAVLGAAGETSTAAPGILASGRAAPTTLVSVRGGIGGFAQDGDWIAWLWPTAACRDFVQLRDLRTGRQVRLAAPRGATCPPADAYIPESLALAGDRALWSVDDEFPGLSGVDFRVYVVEGRIGKRDRVVARYWDREEKDDDGNFATPDLPMAGDGGTLVYDWGGAVRRVVSGRGVRIVAFKGPAYFAVSGGRAAIASQTWAGGCVCNRDWRWSPDGTRLAFTSGRSGSSEVYLVNADGSGERRLGAGWSPDWSPDGNQIVFARGGDSSEIVVINVDGSGERRLAAGSSPDWSPDGSEIAYVASNGVHVVNADGTGDRGLVAAYVSFGPVWSPDGSQLAVTTTPGDVSDRLVVVRRDGTGLHTVAQPVWPGPSVAWSPDGKRIAYGASHGPDGVDLHIVHADGSDDRALTGPGGKDIWVAWSPDGRQIAFVRAKSFSADSDVPIDPRLWIMNADGTVQTRLTQGEADESSPVWSPDGTRIAFGRGGEAYVVGPNRAGEARVTTTHPEEPRSAGGVFAADSGRQLGTFAVVGRVRAVAVSPAVLAVLASGFFGEQIELFDPHLGQARGSVAVEANTADALSAAGERIVFRVDRKIMLLNAATRRLTLLAVAAATPIGLSIEGRRVAWAENLGRRARVRAVTAP